MPKLSVKLTETEADFWRLVSEREGYKNRVGPRAGEGSLQELLGAIARGERRMVIFPPDARPVGENGNGAGR